MSRRNLPRKWSTSFARVLLASCLFRTLNAIAGDFLWNQEVSVDIGSESDVVECVPNAVRDVRGVTVDKKKILHQYKIVPIDMTIGNEQMFHGDARRTGPRSAKIAFYGRQENEPVPFKSEIAAKLDELRAAVALNSDLRVGV